MNINLRIWKWAVFELNILTHCHYDESTFTYFAIGFLPFYLCIEKYYERISFIFQIGWDGREVIWEYEKILKEVED